MQLPDLFTLSEDARITARGALYVATFMMGWWARSLFGEAVHGRARRMAAFFKGRR